MQNWKLFWFQSCKPKFIQIKITFINRDLNIGILSRTRKLNSTLVKELEEELIDAGINVDRFIKTDQIGCDEKRHYFKPKDSNKKKSSWKYKEQKNEENENFFLKNFLRIF